MSQSLIVFSGSGQVHYQTNTKILAFNEVIAQIVNETATELEPNFYTGTGNQKRFYCYKKDDLYSSLYFDIVTTIDNSKIKQTLAGVLRTYTKVCEDYDEDMVYDKLSSLIDYQFNQLMKLQRQEEEVEVEQIKPINKESETFSTPSTTSTTPKTGKKSKKMRKWVDGEMVDVTDDQVLDFSEGKEVAGGNKEQLKVDNMAFKRENNMVLVNELNDILNESEEEDDNIQQENNPSSGMFSKFKSYFGASKSIEELSKSFYDQLIEKNIAPPTAKTIIDRIKLRLKGKSITLQQFKQTLTEELTKVLSPNVSTDLLYDIKSQTGSKRPYVISVVGVNGVGKSTNLAKLAYWFLQNDLNVLICACDTFRSGAVEQLKVHVNNLKTLNESNDSPAKIDIFEKGYGGGDHVVSTAKLAIQFGTSDNYDVILIDTAGRTHSNAKLMAPLKKFGDAANPDKIIMVGEALVGTDSVEQAQNFNGAFGNKRGLDFFIISKVDTVGDLLGTMINMVMATNVPILFMGTGQTYTDIKRLNVKTVVEMLMR